MTAIQPADTILREVSLDDKYYLKARVLISRALKPWFACQYYNTSVIKSLV